MPLTRATVRTRTYLDIRDIVQAAFGAMILQPDEALVSAAQQNSLIMRVLGASSSSAAATPGGLELLHTFVLVAGFGLLVGASMTTSIAIAAFVVLGVAGGLFAVGELFNSVGVNLTNFSQAVATVADPIVSLPLIADLYLLLPVIVLVFGVARWRYAKGVERTRRAETTHQSLRHYCAFCGSVVEPGARRCTSCRKSVPRFSRRHCADCGRRIGSGAAYCWFCGDEVEKPGEGKCPSCGSAIADGAKFCPECGFRIPKAARTEVGGEPEPAEGEAAEEEEPPGDEELQEEGAPGEEEEPSEEEVPPEKEPSEEDEPAEEEEAAEDGSSSEEREPTGEPESSA